jgi:arabinogalactan endo-1,4-beta-galactosidase
MKKRFFIITILLSTLSVLSFGQVTSPIGKPAEIVVTPYKTTMLADGKDKAVIKISVIDKQGNTIENAVNLILFKVSGDAKIVSFSSDNNPTHTPGANLQEKLYNGRLTVVLQGGITRGTVKFDATSEGLSTGSTEIHTVQPGKAHAITSGTPIAGNAIITDKIIGADISALPQLEERGMKFYDKDGKPGDAIQMMKANGFNYIRLRIFNHPELERGIGYSPGKGFCDLAHTMQMAKRIKASGMKFLLDFHYSDTWADPQRQNTPVGWNKLDFNTLKDSLYNYTKNVMQALKDQGTAPDMVQVGNEINHGLMWPNGEINNLDSLATLIYAGVKAVKQVNPATSIMLHIALGGQNDESRFFLDNMLKRKVPFDVIGLSYYPKWHGTLSDLKSNMSDLAARYKKYVMVAEYSQLKQEVNDIAFNVPNNKALGTFIWEPLSTWESVFNRDGKVNTFMDVYPAIARKYNVH